MNSCSPPKLCPVPLYIHVIKPVDDHAQRMEVAARKVLSREELQSVIEDSKQPGNEHIVSIFQELNALADFREIAGLDEGESEHFTLQRQHPLRYAGKQVGYALLTKSNFYEPCYETRISPTGESVQSAEDEGGRLVTE